MVLLFLFLTGMILVAVYQSGRLVSQKSWGELAAFGALWLAATAYASLVILEVPIPNTTDAILFIFSRIYELLGIDVM